MISTIYSPSECIDDTIVLKDMKISPDGSSTCSQNNGVQQAPRNENETSFQKQMLVTMEEISAKLTKVSVGKESELARCVMDLVQANERLTGQVNNLSLQFAGHGTTDVPSDGTIGNLATQMKNLQDSLKMASDKERDELKQSIITTEQKNSDLVWNLSILKEGFSQLKRDSQMTSEERDELKRSVFTLEKEKSDLFTNLSNIQKECAQLKSELTDVKKDRESSIAALKEGVAAARTTQGPLVQPMSQYVWKSSKDVCVSGIHRARVELLECPPMTSGVHKWSIFVEGHTSRLSFALGVASTVHSFEKKSFLGNLAGGWAYYGHAQACHNSRVVKLNLPKFQKGSKVTFILDLTGGGSLSASVDGKSFHQLFSNMLSVVRRVNPVGGFVPAVGLNLSKVRFLGFERIFP
jgi:hypothetical protein